ncbi:MULTISPECIES: carboxylating nicotinate-nucleotide diphosphorylase [Rossellomorea]|uniref:carboxylating nicotinate-nucleotide diphosphorylase n=1 Tax=Rossellomorea TaxID=2837508 RepID=UPI001CCE1494|nr:MULTISPECIES: carboxylating nicotinate-nucleotide diphosphorylase [Rossellomorea]MCA0147453.1 carboxylating nicotinate-nucleotide diphosphorylase [Rossellomorea vietnamensis]WGG44370.1 carboxylating nicotinate-nucleotide diphosphorylase [Rossellomorea sp. DA94]
MNKMKLKSMLETFYQEDLGDGDLSSEFLFSKSDEGSFSLFMKEQGVFCGRDVIEIGFSLMDPKVDVQVFAADGDWVEAGQSIAEVRGPMGDLLQGERVVLNLIQRMSGIATATYRAVEEVKGTGVRLCDTRKTTPGLRMLEKYAVRTGGGFNHRNGLYDAVMLKDNHISFAGSITEAVKQVKKRIGHMVKVEVEIETKEQLLEAIDAGADVIMFDNCTPSTIKEWIHLVPPHIVTEASGGITRESLHAYAGSGVHYISLGYLTHSVKSLDISARVRIGKGV